MALQGASSSLSSASTSSIHPWTHDVFLSFRGKDVRQKFISHLYNALDKRGINTYMDDELERGEECMDTIKQIVLPVFYKLDPSDVRHQKESFGVAFAKLKDRFKGKVEVQKWEAALEELANMAGMVNQTPLSVAKYPIGIESRIRHIYRYLNIGMNDIICIVGIFETGGIGKTTISKDIYNRAGGLIKLQNTLLYDILGTSLDVHDIDKGINVIRHRLCSKRVLLILDDVDEIIITTRDQCLLDNSKVDSKHEVMILDDNEALQLFSLHAFEEKEPLKDYMDLSKQVIKYAQGLPLALTVLGSDLKGQSIHQWRSALNKYKSIPNSNIQKVLLVSYEGLDDTEREIFLDIAFFFKGESLANVIKIFDCCDFFPVHGIKRLIDKCLITTEGRNEYIWMHDLVQDMGREVVRLESPNEPCKRSRLWFHEDIREVLEESMGPNKIEGILVDLPECDKEISLHPEAFRHMKRLRVLINRNARFSCAPNYLSDKLSVLDWSKYPVESLPRNFQGKKLVILRMRDSFVKDLGDGFKPKNLTSMTFYDCKFLKKIPDLSSISNLKELTVQECTKLVEVHDSVRSLENLSKLDFCGCSKLQILPRSLNLRSLRWLLLADCSSLRYLPEIECKMECLTRLTLDGTAIEELPLSIKNLVGLEELYLWDCKNLIRLPIACIQLQHLWRLDIGGNCPNIVEKKRDDGLSLLAIESAKMEEEISLREERLHELAPPTNSSNGSTTLQLLNLQSCFQLETNFFPISSLFTMFNYSTNLLCLNLSNTEIVSLPMSIKGFIKLIDLDLRFCRKLEEIPKLPPNIRQVDVTGCESLEIFLEVSKILEFNGSHIRSLGRIDLDNCYKMHENIWNDKMQNPLLWKGVYEYDATLFPENQIPEWLSYIHEFLKDSEMVKETDDYVRPRGEEEWVIDIEGPHYLEEINGIVLYVVIFFKDATGWKSDIGGVKITSNSSNHICCIQEGVQLVNMDWYKKGNRTGYDVWVGYSNLQSFEQKVLANLRVQFDDFHHHYDGMVLFYKSCRAKVVYNNERSANKRRIPMFL
ncbi:hypothetical protein I3843_15G127200 [Carya illinoinensis]|nr:hypothetical protein I3843_15G127200 [Carya illinoinensis]